MEVTLATGIYPPEIGGPATYVRELAIALRAKGVKVSIVAYGDPAPGDDRENVARVSRSGGPIGRYVRYAKALRAVAASSDVVEAFSSVSVGVPLWLAHLRGPKKILRLGGDFLWERATDRGEEAGLEEWYGRRPPFVSVLNGLLRTFDALVFSTQFQEDLYARVYSRLPPSTVIENVSPSGTPVAHAAHAPLRLLYLGRFVAFKNIPSLVAALAQLPEARLTLVGSGPMERTLREAVSYHGVGDRVEFRPPVHGEEKKKVLLEHDLLVVPSHTDISPNTALEARAAGLPVLITRETGLSRTLLEGMVPSTLATPDDIVLAVRDAAARYDAVAARAAEPLPERDWNRLADEHLALFSSLL